MSEISVPRAEREVSKIKTMDFFANIFTSAINNSDPFETIENLEIILDPHISEYDIDDDGIKGIQELTKFLQGSNVHFKLSLWQRLRDVSILTCVMFTKINCSSRHTRVWEIELTSCGVVS